MLCGLIVNDLVRVIFIGWVGLEVIFMNLRMVYILLLVKCVFLCMCGMIIFYLLIENLCIGLLLW